MEALTGTTTEQKAAALRRSLDLLFPLILLLFFRFMVDPRLIYHARQPVFFYDLEFLKKHLTYPAGPCEWASIFITQFFTDAWIGAAWLTVIAAVTALVLRRLFRPLPLPAAFAGSWLIAGTAAALQSDYFFPLQPWLTLLLVLFFYRALQKSATLPLATHAALCLAAAAALYYLCGAAAFVLPWLLVLSSRNRIRTILLVFSAIAVWLLPLLFQQVLPSDPKSLYTCGLPLANTEKSKTLWFAVWTLFIVFLAAAQWFELRRRTAEDYKKVMPLAAAALIVLIGDYSSFRYVFLPKEKTVLLVDRAAELRRWAEVLKIVEAHPDVHHQLITLQHYRALFFSGLLGGRLFEAPAQGADALYRTDRQALVFPVAYADLSIDLGNVNGALHKTYEAWAVEGLTPRVLQRLIILHAAKKEFAAAEKYLRRLKAAGKLRAWRLKYEHLCRSRSLEDEELRRLSRFAEAGDFLMRPAFARAELKELVRVSPNHMAAEYLLAYDLLAGNLEAFMDGLPSFLAHNDELPKAFEEAAVLYLNSGLPLTDAQQRLAVRRSTVDAFKRFVLTLQKYGNDKTRAFAELKQNFGSTFWFYFLYLDKGEAE